ncbi:hypothetical protein FRC17_007997, partial [Serendipita sp. 399]
PIKLVRFVVTTFRNDEEMQKIHLPICFTGLLELISIMVAEDATFTQKVATRDALLLIRDMLSFVPPSSLSHPLGEIGSTPKRPYTLATEFYSINPIRSLPPKPDSASRKHVPVTTAAEDLFSFTLACVTSSTSTADVQVSQALDQKKTLEVVLTSTKLLQELVAKVAGKQSIQVVIMWDASAWRDALLGFIEQARSFEIVDNVISLLIDLSKAAVIEPKVNIDTRPLVGRMMNILLEFLRPQYVQYHVRTTKLIWALEGSTTYRHVEALIAESLTVKNGLPTYDAYEAFGVLWRLSDDALLPGFKFRVPLFNVLDTMRSDDPALRRLGETWMRCSLKSYMRILDPVMYELMDPTVRRTPATYSWQGRDTKLYNYEKPFDSSRVVYLLDTLTATLRFGGQGIAKVARGTPVKKSGHPEVYKRAFAMGILRGDDSYMDILIEILLRLLQSEPIAPLLPMIGPANSRIQSLSIDLLQTIIARGEMSIETLESIEAVV